MTASQHERCNRCRFWLENTRHRDPNDENWGFGVCRRDTPKVVDCMVQALMPKLSYGQQEDPELDTVSMSTCSMWPATGAADWCGRFEEGAA